MTARIFCDKCGTDFSDDHRKLYIGDIKTIPLSLDIDLCRGCTTKFTNWLKEEPNHE